VKDGTATVVEKTSELNERDYMMRILYKKTVISFIFFTFLSRSPLCCVLSAGYVYTNI